MKDATKEHKENTTEEKEKDSAEDGEEGETEEGKQIAISSGPRALHKTFSLFMRSVPPNISKADIAAVSKVNFVAFSGTISYPESSGSLDSGWAPGASCIKLNVRRNC